LPDLGEDALTMSHLPRADFPAAARPNLADSSPWRVRFRAIYEDLRKKIILLDFPPGTRLDVEALAREHDVSRTPIRTVIQRLESEGLAITRHGVGTTVTEIDFAQVHGAMQFRMHLAELIGTLNPRPPSPDLVGYLERLYEEFEKVGDTAFPAEFARIDMLLHDQKCQLIGNDLLRRTYDEMYYRTVRTWFHFLPRIDWKTERDALLRDIAQTTTAVRRGDIAAVGFVTRNAISDGLFRLSGLISQIENAEAAT
jgi:DNA-binding GntR family transcriptional regulator